MGAWTFTKFTRYFGVGGQGFGSYPYCGVLCATSMKATNRRLRVSRCFSLPWSVKKGLVFQLALEEIVYHSGKLWLWHWSLLHHGAWERVVIPSPHVKCSPTKLGEYWFHPFGVPWGCWIFGWWAQRFPAIPLDFETFGDTLQNTTRSQTFRREAANKVYTVCITCLYIYMIYIYRYKSINPFIVVHTAQPEDSW